MSSSESLVRLRVGEQHGARETRRVREHGRVSASRGAAVPSRHRCDSCPSDEVVDGFFFYFEAVRTASSDERRRCSAQVIKHRLWPDILQAAAKQRAADEEQARKDELKRLKEEQARQAELERRKRLQLDSKAGKRREFGRVMWKVTSQEITRRTKRAFLKICGNLYTPGEDGLRGCLLYTSPSPRD